MQTAVSSPHPYLLNRAGGIVQIHSFSLLGDKLTLDALSDKPLTGVYQLVYRCDAHGPLDIKRNIESDGQKWSLLEPLPAEEDCDVCYPEPCS